MTPCWYNYSAAIKRSHLPGTAQLRYSIHPCCLFKLFWFIQSLMLQPRVSCCCSPEQNFREGMLMKRVTNVSCWDLIHGNWGYSSFWKLMLKSHVQIHNTTYLKKLLWRHSKQNLLLNMIDQKDEMNLCCLALRKTQRTYSNMKETNTLKKLSLVCFFLFHDHSK